MTFLLVQNFMNSNKDVNLCNHHNWNIEQFHRPPKLQCYHFVAATPDLFSIPIVLSFRGCLSNKCNKTLRNLWDWLFSHSIKPFKIIQVALCINSSFLLLLSSLLWYGYILFIHLPIEGHLDCF